MIVIGLFAFPPVLMPRLKWLLLCALIEAAIFVAAWRWFEYTTSRPDYDDGAGDFMFLVLIMFGWIGLGVGIAIRLVISSIAWALVSPSQK